jgi:hypothetical protein
MGRPGRSCQSHCVQAGPDKVCWSPGSGPQHGNHLGSLATSEVTYICPMQPAAISHASKKVWPSLHRRLAKWPQPSPGPRVKSGYLRISALLRFSRMAAGQTANVQHMTGPGRAGLRLIGRTETTQKEHGMAVCDPQKASGRNMQQAMGQYHASNNVLNTQVMPATQASCSVGLPGRLL